jgi:nicotinate-nucleotide adenylyltransferase
VIGSDAFRGLPTWHRWQEVLDLAHLVVLRRPGVPLVLSGPLEALMSERRTRDLPDGPGRQHPGARPDDATDLGDRRARRTGGGWHGR